MEALSILTDLFKSLIKLHEKVDKLFLEQKEVLNFEEAIAFLNVSKSFLYSAIANGKVTHYKPSRKLTYFNKSDLLNFARQNQKISASANGTSLTQEVKKISKRKKR